tara:strand:+ start:1270 stop:1395 length:126 start_codon:yes stop_codon:yes gene_type:complete
VLGWRRGLKEHPSLTLPLKREGEGTEKAKTPAEAGVFSGAV